MGFFNRTEEEVDEDWETAKREVKAGARSAYNATEEGFEKYSEKGAKKFVGAIRGGNKASAKIRSGTMSLFKALTPRQGKSRKPRRFKKRMYW